jgi:uncharacterized protein (TIGR02246 family)
MRALMSIMVCCVGLASPGIAGPQEKALSVLQKWTGAFAASDVDAIVKLYAPDALFLGTGSKTVVTETQAIGTHFEEALLTRRPRAAPMRSQEAMVLSDHAVLATGLNESTGVQDGKSCSNPGRVTFVIAKRGPEWLIAHFHRSAMPK